MRVALRVLVSVCGVAALILAMGLAGERAAESAFEKRGVSTAPWMSYAGVDGLTLDEFWKRVDRSPKECLQYSKKHPDGGDKLLVLLRYGGWERPDLITEFVKIRTSPGEVIETIEVLATGVHWKGDPEWDVVYQRAR